MIKIELHLKSSTFYTKGARLLFVPFGHEHSIKCDRLYKNYQHLSDVLKERGFKGCDGEILSLPLPQDGSDYVILIGLGSAKKGTQHFCIESYRRALAKGMRAAVGLRVPSITIELPSAELYGVEVEHLIEQTVIIMRMSSYHFDDYITDQDRKEHRIEVAHILADGDDQIAMQTAIDKGNIVADAVNKARHWIDTPPLHATPLFLAQKAKDLEAQYDLKVTVFNEQQIVAMGMGGLAGVSVGSDVDCQFAVIEYKTTELNAPTIALVGKGITFDSGGLSIKPAQSMETMKDDMSGAAAVIVVMEAFARLKPKVNVIGFTPMSENLPSGKAIKPGDVLKFYNGKTAEVKNTDAEGRLILADALSYAVKHYKPDAMIDIATLTGACAYALGPYFTGLMSEHDDLALKIEHAGKKSGDQVWRLPMTNDYKRAIKSDIADICNIGDGRIKAGAITAAHFLQHFVEDVPWAHLDIAGTAFDVPHIPYYRSGATGAGVRLFIELIMNWK